MSYLFDVGEKPTKAKRRTAEPKPAVQEPAFAPQDSVVLVEKIIGRADDLFDCLSCGGRAHDVIEVYRGRWKVECCFCGTKQSEDAVAGVLPEAPAEGVFVMPGGRYDGLTLAEVASTSRGAGYIRWAAGGHPNEPVKDACQKWLDALRANSLHSAATLGTEPISHACTDTEARRPHLHP